MFTSTLFSTRSHASHAGGSRTDCPRFWLSPENSGAASMNGQALPNLTRGVGKELAYSIELILSKSSSGKEFGSERSGKRAKPDAMSAEANARARALHIPRPPNTLPSPNVLPPGSPSASTSDVIACAPGPSTMPSGAFSPTPKPSTAHTFPPGPGNLHALTCRKSRDTIEGRRFTPLTLPVARTIPPT
jgi:hypothetical protein